MIRHRVRWGVDWSWCDATLGCCSVTDTMDTIDRASARRSVGTAAFVIALVLGVGVPLVIRMLAPSDANPGVTVFLPLGVTCYAAIQLGDGTRGPSADSAPVLLAVCLRLPRRRRIRPDLDGPVPVRVHIRWTPRRVPRIRGDCRGTRCIRGGVSMVRPQGLGPRTMARATRVGPQARRPDRSRGCEFGGRHRCPRGCRDAAGATH